MHRIPNQPNTHIMSPADNLTTPKTRDHSHTTTYPHLHEGIKVLPLAVHMDMRGTHVSGRPTSPLKLHAKPNTNTEKLAPTQHYHILYNSLPYSL